MTKTKEELIAEAWEKYLAIEKAACEEYIAIRDPALKEYVTIKNAAWKEYYAKLAQIKKDFENK